MLKTKLPKSLYIHVPFCKSKCGYCAFNSFSGLEDLQDIYINALCKDIEASLQREQIISIFIGGGTPNILQVKHYDRIFNTITRHAYLAPEIEITLEANPDLVSLEWCHVLKNLGMTRLSIGVQSFFGSKLHFLQRDHIPKNVYKALDYAQKSAIEHLSIDLIYNTPLDTPQSIEKEVSLASTLPIDHLSAYSLTLEDNTKLAKVASKNLPELDVFMRASLEAQGFEHYEVSNYARNYRVKHNLHYWNALEYIGCGAGAVGRVGQTRYYKFKDVKSYIANPLHARTENLTQQDLHFEAVFLGLRCALGVPVNLLMPKKIKTLIDEDICYQRGDCLLAKNFFLADEIALWLSH
ncbi:radical SAM family heme chaperone HemW [Helicobacter cynogastricus]|uniref:radical SAM family heme chaperone HemW n=1 Tax=Helicobacter cynogastricus TaxID=329937 RepID=UPI000CF0A5BC|nr:radical SAM family heme chaperone HemW [Helicobacter cynogastricus]